MILIWNMLNNNTCTLCQYLFAWICMMKTLQSSFPEKPLTNTYFVIPLRRKNYKYKPFLVLQKNGTEFDIIFSLNIDNLQCSKKPVHWIKLISDLFYTQIKPQSRFGRFVDIGNSADRASWLTVNMRFLSITHHYYSNYHLTQRSK